MGVYFTLPSPVPSPSPTSSSRDGGVAAVAGLKSLEVYCWRFTAVGGMVRGIKSKYSHFCTVENHCLLDSMTYIVDVKKEATSSPCSSNLQTLLDTVVGTVVAVYTSGLHIFFLFLDYRYCPFFGNKNVDFLGRY